MTFKEFMEEYWLKSIILFVVISAFSIITIVGHNILSANQGLLFELFSNLLFFISLTILWPYLVTILVTEIPKVSAWNINSLLIVAGAVLNVVYVYIVSCALIKLVLWVKK
ncbi:hypothetical protein KY345_00110 [Candidatus Woesearchaeota archaeon]|nr:hypothetical protein [Candidatus Woesearchaeota archaeon]